MPLTSSPTCRRVCGRRAIRQTQCPPTFERTRADGNVHPRSPPRPASQPATKASGSRAQGQAPRQGERPSTAAHTQRRRRLTLNGRSFRCWNDLAPHQMARSGRGRQPVNKSPDADRKFRVYGFCLKCIGNTSLSRCEPNLGHVGQE